MSIRTPAEVFPPGDFIREELESRGWTQGNLAKITGRPVSAINLIISAKKAITPETACELAGAFGTSPEFWLNLESAYRLSMLESTNEAIRDRAKIFGASPVKEMEERNWIPRTESVDELRKELSKFYFLASSGEGLNLKVAARAKARTAEVLIPEQIAWCVQALRLATSVSVSTFKPQTLADGIRELRALATYPQEVKYVPRVLSQIGIRFVVVRHLTKTKIDGAALWLGDGWDSPVIALSMRHDRIDYFWHTLLHELSHIKNQDTWVLDDDLQGTRITGNSQITAIEERADAEAADMLIPKQAMDSFIARTRPFYSKQRIVQFANLHKIHPGIVAGQLQYRGETLWSANREMLEKVRDVLISQAMTDGWESWRKKTYENKN
jgi:HTH-type transcriptional regulator/antitoxin HigA